MPLLDHFSPPLSRQRHGESFFLGWECSLADAVNANLAPGWFAEIHVALNRSSVEDDSPAVVSATAPPLELPFTFPDKAEVLVYSTEGGLNVVGAIELVSL